MLSETNYDAYLNRQIDLYTDGDDTTNSNCCDAFINENGLCSECGEHCVSIAEAKEDYQEDMWERR